MAGEGPADMIAKRVTDDLISFSGETAPLRFMKFFLVQKVAESRRFVNHMHDKAATARDCVAQPTALIAELQVMQDQKEVHDSLLAAKGAKKGEQAKLVAFNDVIAEALDEIETLKNNVEILDCIGDDAAKRFICVWMLDVDVAHPLGVVFGDIIIGFFTIVDWCSHLVDRLLYYAVSVEGCSTVRLQLCLLSMGPFFILEKLGEVAESPRLPDKIKVAFDQARKEEASFAALMRELCCSLRVSLSKKRRLAAELEGLGEQGDAVRALENMK
ncbi:hypothetical protein Tco_0829915 [Tanacetum coccineum]